MSNTHIPSGSDKAAAPDNILEEISRDYLLFCLTHGLDGRQFNFTLSNQTHISVLDNGILGVNLEKPIDDNTKSIILSCGVHGNETAPIEICNRLIQQILNGDFVTPHRVLFLFGNIPAIHIGKRFVEENLNRLFTKPVTSKSLEAKRAETLMQVVDEFFKPAHKHKYHYDLHTAIRPSKNEKFAVYPYLHGGKHSKEQLAFLSACEINTILLSQTPTTTFSYYSSKQHGAHAFTVELGKVMPFGQNNMHKFAKVTKQLTLLLANTDLILPGFEECPLEIYTVNQVINKQHSDFTLHFKDDLANFSTFKKGTVLATQSGNTYIAQQNGEAIVFPNADVEIGQRALLTVIPYEL